MPSTVALIPGGIWERHCETELKKVGFEAALTSGKTAFYHPKKRLLLVVYVDDVNFKLAGPKGAIKEGWDLISSVMDKDLPEVIGGVVWVYAKRADHNLMFPRNQGRASIRHVFEPKGLLEGAGDLVSWLYVGK